MAGPGLLVNNDTTYPDDGSDLSVHLHQTDHDAIHGIVNHIDKDTPPAGNGQVWVSTSGVMVPRALTAVDAAAAPLIETVHTVATGGSAQTLSEPAAATVNDITLTASCTITLPTGTPGSSCTLALRQGGTGSYTVTFSPTPKYAAGTAPVLSTAVGAVDILTLFYVTTWNCAVVGTAFA
jgi:hypothetical protein